MKLSLTCLEKGKGEKEEKGGKRKVLKKGFERRRKNCLVIFNIITLILAILVFLVPLILS